MSTGDLWIVESRLEVSDDPEDMEWSKVKHTSEYPSESKAEEIQTMFLQQFAKRLGMVTRIRKL